MYDCNNQFKLPKTLPCLHTFCASCLDQCIKACADQNKNFCCPICKQKANLETVVIDYKIFNLVETRDKTPWYYNQSFRASCPSCRVVNNLEACFDCHQPVCKQCSVNHFGVWKDDLNKKFNSFENNLTECLSNIGKLNKINFFLFLETFTLIFIFFIELLQPSVDKNFKNIKKIEAEIEFKYEILIKAIDAEKSKLLESLNNIKTERYDIKMYKSNQRIEFLLT